MFVFGESHAACLQHAWEQRRFRPDSPALDFKFILTSHTAFRGDSLTAPSDQESIDAIHPELANAFEQYGVMLGSTEAWLVSVVGGTNFNVIGLFEPEPLFDFIHPDAPDLPLREGVPMMPYDLVMSQFREEASHTYRLLAALPRKKIAGILHLEGPPPIPSHRQIAKSLEHALLRKCLKRHEAVPISSRELRLKLWKCQCDANREACAQANVLYVTPPEEAIDEEGYLRPKAWLGATHASAWYGALALKKIERLVASERRRAGCMGSPAGMAQ